MFIEHGAGGTNEEYEILRRPDYLQVPVTESKGRGFNLRGQKRVGRRGCGNCGVGRVYSKHVGDTSAFQLHRFQTAQAKAGLGNGFLLCVCQTIDCAVYATTLLFSPTCCCGRFQYFELRRKKPGVLLERALHVETCIDV